ncbi:MAG: YdiU family protein [Rickettsiales bacterium]|nr:YdiU family protein [Rickettsiales bacterium]
MTNKDISRMGWRFDNSYARLPDAFYTRMKPVKVQNPKLVIINDSLVSALDLKRDALCDDVLAQLFSGNVLPDGAESIAQAYAGHQFGHFTMLGDGRAHLIGEHITSDGKRFDIQFKGSGKTAYARQGDGRAVLGPMLREYIISEAMHALGIATTRSLAVVTTGEIVYRETALPGAILTRVASSHVRVGTFEFLAAHKDVEGLKILADYAIDRHYPDIKESDQPYLDLIKAVMLRQIGLVIEWLRVGFIHGVMNTDNTTISGETIDYGPCAFMDAYDPKTVFSSIDQMGRYAYANQPHIVQWNVARLAEALLPLLHDDLKQSVTLAEEVINAFNHAFQTAWICMMRKKLGIFGEEGGDEVLIGDLLKWMQRHHTDYTNTFRELISETLPEDPQYQSDEFRDWWERWQNRLQQNNIPLNEALALMQSKNPAVIPRNHHVEAALSAAEEESDYGKLHQLLDALSEPYEGRDDYEGYDKPPAPNQRVYQTFCGT